MSEEIESKMELTQENNAGDPVDYLEQTPRQKPPQKEPITKNGIIYFVICLCLALVLFAVVAPKLENVDSYGSLAETLDDKKEQVIGLSATLAGLSVVIAAVPGDATTPIADNVAGLSSYLVVVLGALMLEKFLLPIMALISWRILLPIGVILLGLFLMLKKRRLYEWAIRTIVIGVMVFVIIPAGIVIGNVIDNSFNVENSIEQIKLEFAEIDDDSDETEETVEEDGEKTILDNIAEFASDAWDTLTGAGANLIKKAKVIIGETLEVIAAFIVTTCVIPIGVIFIIYAAAKGILSLIMRRFNIDLPKGKGLKQLPQK